MKILRANSVQAIQGLSGLRVSDWILSDIKPKVLGLRAKGVIPKLVPILVGDDESSHIYIDRKKAKAKQVGINVDVKHLAKTTSSSQIKAVIAGLNADPTTHGVIVQLPLPGHLSERTICNMVLPSKDVDGFTSHNLGSLMQSYKTDVTEDYFMPCTALAVKHILKFYFEHVDFSGKKAVVLGRSMNVGLPISLMLQGDSEKGGFDMTVTICHKRSEQLEECTRKADMIVTAAGVPGLVTADMVKPGAIVIDVGLSRIDGKKTVVGDCDNNVYSQTNLYTPVPGGVGPCTVASLLENTVLAAERSIERTKE